jgi:hypothetical protein
MTNPYTWAEELPEGCPPRQADPSEGIYYRLGNKPPTEEDFFSHRKLYPLKVFKVDECRALSVSVFNDLDAVKQLFSLPTMKGKPINVLELSLTPENGVILQTGRDVHHYSWWKSSVFDLSKCVAL